MTETWWDRIVKAREAAAADREMRKGKPWAFSAGRGPDAAAAVGRGVEERRNRWLRQP